MHRQGGDTLIGLFGVCGGDDVGSGESTLPSRAFFVGGEPSWPSVTFSSKDRFSAIVLNREVGTVSVKSKASTQRAKVG